MKIFKAKQMKEFEEREREKERDRVYFEQHHKLREDTDEEMS